MEKQQFEINYDTASAHKAKGTWKIRNNLVSSTQWYAGM